MSCSSRRRLVGLVVSALATGLTGTGFAAFSVPSAGASSPPPIGFYEGAENASGVNAFGIAFGRQPSYAMDYLDGTSWSSMVSSAAKQARFWSRTTYAMTFSVPMLPNTGSTLAAGAAGNYDSYFKGIAQGLVAHDEASSILRIGWEFNEGWFSWAADSSDSTQFVAFWHQIVDSMRSVRGAAFKFEWCPNLGDAREGNLANYYPGNRYVDYVAADVYDQTWARYPGAKVQFSNLETEPFGLHWLTSFAAQRGRPVALGEWGLGSGPGNSGRPYSADGVTVSGGDDPTFIKDMAKWIASNGVAEALYFDFGSSALSSTSNANSYRALIQAFGPGGVASGPAGSSQFSRRGGGHHAPRGSHP
jgi:hypothetical protein